MLSLFPNQKVEFTLGVILVVTNMQSNNSFGSINLLVVNALHQKTMKLFASPRIKEWV